jgi:D-alanine--poly(phosphoribitol) ligase subunit 1
MKKLVTPPEALEIHRNINATDRPYPDQSGIKELFERCARNFGNKIATISGAEALSYRELDQLANGVAYRLQRGGVHPGDCVAVCCDRSTELILALLAVAKCGASYLPLNPSWPSHLLSKIADAFGCRLVITAQRCLEHSPFPEHRMLRIIRAEVTGRATSPKVETGGEAIAYVNFTSGTTGDPKGVPIRHRSIARLVFDTAYAPIDEHSVLLQMSPVTFDAATFEIWGALLRGGICVLYPPEHLRLSVLRRVVRRAGVTVMFATTALFNVVVDEAPDSLDTVQTILTGGEQYSHRHISKALRRYGPGRVVHVYGPTECTTFATYHPVSQVPAPPGHLPIGKPIQNTRIYVAGEQALCRAGEVGEILIAGPGLSPGYLGNNTSDEAAFAEYDISGQVERVYRTGDYGRLLGSGELIFEGRRDDRIKVDGFRIQLAEVSRVIGDHPLVRQCYVTAAETAADAGGKVLAAFIVADSGDLTAAVLRDHMRSLLPQYMVPSVIQFCDRLPLTTSGKVDRQELFASCQGRLRNPSALTGEVACHDMPVEEEGGCIE